MPSTSPAARPARSLPFTPCHPSQVLSPEEVGERLYDIDVEELHTLVMHALERVHNGTTPMLPGDASGTLFHLLKSLGYYTRETLITLAYEAMLIAQAPDETDNN